MHNIQFLPMVVKTVEQKNTALRVVHFAISSFGRIGIPSSNEA